MQGSTFAQLALSLSLVFAAACGGAHKHAESPDPTETGWSGASSDGAQGKAGPSIQPTKSDDPAKVVASKNSPPVDSAAKPEGMSQAEADIIAGRALPPPPKAAADKGAAEKPAKPKKPAKTRKKPAKPA